MNAEYNCLFLSRAHYRNNGKPKSQQRTKQITGKLDQLTEAQVHGNGSNCLQARHYKIKAPLVNQAT